MHAFCALCDDGRKADEALSTTENAATVRTSSSKGRRLDGFYVILRNTVWSLCCCQSFRNHYMDRRLSIRLSFRAVDAPISKWA